MKNHLLFFILFSINPVFSQQAAQFYQTVNGEYAFMFDGNNCTLYELSQYEIYVYRKWELTHAGEFKKQSDSLGVIFSNGLFAISYDYKYFRVLKLKNGKPKDRLTFLAKKMDDPAKIHEGINHAFWDAEYRKTIDQISRDFPLFSDYYYRDRLEIWNSFDFKQVLPEEFEALANLQNDLLRDSLSKTNQKLIELNESINNQMDTLTIEPLKSNFLSRPLYNYAYSEYTDQMLTLLAEKRPDLFFRLADSEPHEKKLIFDQVLYARDANKALKRYDTDSPVKKEYLKYKRKESLKGGLILTGAILLESAIIGGLVTGIVYLVSN